MSSEAIIKNGYKLTIGRKRTRITTYENLRLQTTKPKDKPKKPEQSNPSSYSDHNYYNRQRQRRETVKELAYNSFEYLNSTMLTLTFNRPMTDLTEAHKIFYRFIKRVNDHYNNFRYLATFSRQANGSWHYHVLTNLPATTQNDTISELWQNGYTYITFFDTQSKFDTAITYIIANMVSSSQDTKGKHGYLASKNCERNLIITSYKTSDIEQFDNIFPQIQKAKNTILYEAKSHLGVKATYEDPETGELHEVHIPNQELDAMMVSKGYEEWETTFTHLTSSARFEEQFTTLVPATPKPKKYKRKKSKKQ